MKNVLCIAALLGSLTFSAHAITITELNPYNGYAMVPNVQGEIQMAPQYLLKTNVSEDQKVFDITMPVYGRFPQTHIITEYVKRFHYDYNTGVITMTLAETNFIDGRTGKVIKKGVHKKPKTIILQPNTYGYMEAMYALGATGK